MKRKEKLVNYDVSGWIITIKDLSGDRAIITNRGMSEYKFVKSKFFRSADNIITD